MAPNQQKKEESPTLSQPQSPKLESPVAPQVEEPKLKEVPPPDKDVKELIIKKEKPKKKVAEPKKPQVIHDRPGHITIK